MISIFTIIANGSVGCVRSVFYVTYYSYRIFLIYILFKLRVEPNNIYILIEWELEVIYAFIPKCPAIHSLI